MKIMLYSDIHIDKNFFNKPNLQKEENYRTRDFILEALETYKPDLQIFLGDLFDVVDNIDIIPYIRIRQFLEGKETKESTVRGWVDYSNIYMISGNHDLLDLKSSFNLLATLDNITSINKNSSSFRTYIIKTGQIKIIPQREINSLFIFVPYEDDIEKLKNSLNEISKRVPSYGLKNAFIFGHFGISEFLPIDTGELKGIISINDLSSDYFKNITKTYLGHFHKRAKTKDEKIEFIGSTHCLNFNDLEDLERGCLFLDIDSSGNWKEEYYNNPYSSIFIKTSPDKIKKIREEYNFKNRNYYLDIITNQLENSQIQLTQDSDWISSAFSYYRVRSAEIDDINKTLSSFDLKIESTSLEDVIFSFKEFLEKEKNRIELSDEDLKMIDTFLKFRRKGAIDEIEN